MKEVYLIMATGAPTMIFLYLLSFVLLFVMTTIVYNMLMIAGRILSAFFSIFVGVFVSGGLMLCFILYLIKEVF